jgi:hypothetical protein
MKYAVSHKKTSGIYKLTTCQPAQKHTAHFAYGRVVGPRETVIVATSTTTITTSPAAAA